jgi:tetratricopeptide (TPR) repeat protein
VWNELGNVYFNAGSFDDAIAAYGRAIELDRQFAWPYTNLALSYVQKGSLAEAIKLYQRSIELFSNEKDKAITWNRLGNVYRRLNDYENAIAAYQRADELDPGNTAITHQSRFSLLGSEKVDQEARYSL